MTPAGRRNLLFLTKATIAAALLYWLIDTRRLDFGAYRSLFADQGAVIAGALLVQAAAMVIFISRWHSLVQLQRIAISWRDVFRTGFQGLFIQLFVPGGLGGDGLRILHLRREHRDSLAAGISSVLMDRIVGIASLALLGTLASAMHWLGGAGTPVLSLLLSINAAILLAGLLAFGALQLRHRLRDRLPARLRGFVDAASDALHLYARHKKVLLATTAVSTLGHLATCVTAYLCLLALGAEELSFGGVVAISCLLNLLRMVPITPMGLGVTDLAAESLFGLLGLTIGAEQQMLLRAVNVLLFVCAGLAFFWHPPASPEAG